MSCLEILVLVIIPALVGSGLTLLAVYLSSGD